MTKLRLTTAYRQCPTRSNAIWRQHSLTDTKADSGITHQPKTTVRIGIIGPSWWVKFWHLPALQAHPNAMITAVCGANQRDPAELSALYGAQAQGWTDYEKMLDEASLDGVIICTPNDLHYPAAIAALRRGIHVICEKPVAMNAAQALEMARTASEKGLLGMTNFPYRDNPAVQALRQKVVDGYLGTPLHIAGDYHGGFGLNGPPGWRGTTSRSGAGILADLGSHLIDLVRFITQDEFASVCAHTLTLLRNPISPSTPTLHRTEDPQTGDRNDDSCAFLAEFASGAQGVFHTSWVAYQGAEAQQQSIEIFGTGGRLHFLADHTGTLLRGKRTSETHWQEFDIEGTVSPCAGQENEDIFRPGRLTPTNTTYRWIEGIRTGQTDVTPDLTDGWHAQQVIDAVLQASRERRWIQIEMHSKL